MQEQALAELNAKIEAMNAQLQVLWLSSICCPSTHSVSFVPHVCVVAVCCFLSTHCRRIGCPQLSREQRSFCSTRFMCVACVFS